MISLAYKMSHCLSANPNQVLWCVICTGVTLFVPVLHFLHWCYTWTALLSANQNRVILTCVLLSVKLEFNKLFFLIHDLNDLWTTWIINRYFVISPLHSTWSEDASPANSQSRLLRLMKMMPSPYCAVSVLNVCEPHRHWNANRSYSFRAAYFIFEAHFKFFFQQFPWVLQLWRFFIKWYQKE